MRNVSHSYCAQITILSPVIWSEPVERGVQLDNVGTKENIISNLELEDVFQTHHNLKHTNNTLAWIMEWDTDDVDAASTWNLPSVTK